MRALSLRVDSRVVSRIVFCAALCALLTAPVHAVRPSQKQLHRSGAKAKAPTSRAAAAAGAAEAAKPAPQASAPADKTTQTLDAADTAGHHPVLAAPKTPAESSASPGTVPSPIGTAAGVAAPLQNAPAAPSGTGVAAPIATPAAAPAASGQPNAAVKAKVDSLLKMGTIQSRDEDSLAQAEADSGAAPALAGAKPGLPFVMKKPTRKEVAAFQMSVLNAVTAMEKKDFAKARKAMTRAEPTERLAQVYKTILLANVFQGMQDYVRADSVLQSCLDWVGGSTWQSYLLNRRIQIFSLTNPNDSARLQFYAKVIQAPVAASVKINFLYGLLKLQGFAGSPDGFDALLKRIAASAPSDRRLDTLYQSMLPFVPPGAGSWELQEMMLGLESKLGLYAAGIARSEAALKVVPGKPEKQQLHYGYATLLYKNKEYAKAIVAYQKWMDKYGETPEAVLQVARCYDRQEEPKKAIIWYDRLLEKYPKHDKTSEIYWLRAWDLEAAGNYDEAVEFYFRQLADFSANKRGDWANFRIGLCQYKAGNIAAGLQAFKAIRQQVNSNAYPAGLFWEARSQDSLKDSAASRAVLTELSQRYPFNFYGHLARQGLQARGAWVDSLEPWRRFAPSTPEGIKAWMKAEMSGYRERLDNEFESDYLGLGKLLQFRLDTLAILTLRTIPAKTKNNPWFLYVQARQFKNRQLWRESYRLGLQLSYKIAPDKWGSAPKEVLRLIFPRPYEGLVQKFSAKRSLDPAFVYALMRQESGFDRDIKSGAGAVGLMQLMPATGKSVAKKEKWPRFDPYSLVEPEVNIGLGTAYLRDLKKDYKGSFHWVLSNYNAGPEATRRWQAAATVPAPPALATASLGAAPGSWAAAATERPLDAVVEDISYWETRDYVKKVMGNYWTYRILWNNRSKPDASTAAH